MQPDPILEICVDSLELALAAARGGADRIELCGPLHAGGITPSAGLAAAARAMIDLPLAMLVRARTGRFTASAAEFEVMRRDILFARQTGFHIVVLGLLRNDCTVDLERTRELVELAAPMQVTFHRAFDAVPDQQQALPDVIATGATRILTSGARPSAVLGAPAVAHLREAAQGRISMLLCGDVQARTVSNAVKVSGANEVHAALRNYVVFDPSTGLIPEENLKRFTASVSTLKSRLLAQPDPVPSRP